MDFRPVLGACGEANLDCFVTNSYDKSDASDKDQSLKFRNSSKLPFKWF